MNHPLFRNLKSLLILVFLKTASVLTQSAGSFNFVTAPVPKTLVDEQSTSHQTQFAGMISGVFFTGPENKVMTRHLI